MVFAVPKEIIDAIIEELYDCSNALSACSLVSRSFLDASRRTFLSRRAISIQPTAQNIDQLITFLSASHNTRYIYDLRIHYRHRDNDWWAAILPPLLIELSNLHSISICEYGEGGTIDWELVSSAVQTALLTTFRSTSLTNIRLYGLANFPATHFAGLAQLKTLICADCGFKNEWEFLPHDGHGPHVQGNLHSLQVYNPRSAASLNALVEILNHPWSTLGISRLRELLVYGQAFHLTDGLREVMTASGESLETFTWWLEAPQSMAVIQPLDTLNVKAMRNLRIIYLTTDYPELHPHDTLLWLVDALTSPPGLSQLQELIIFVRAPVEEPETLTTNSETWSILNWALTLPTCSNLRRVRVVFTNRPHSRDVWFVSENMPDLYDNGVLEVGSGMNELWGKFLEVYKWKGSSGSSFAPIS